MEATVVVKLASPPTSAPYRARAMWRAVQRNWASTSWQEPGRVVARPPPDRYRARPSAHLAAPASGGPYATEPGLGFRRVGPWAMRSRETAYLELDASLVRSECESNEAHAPGWVALVGVSVQRRMGPAWLLLPLVGSAMPGARKPASPLRHPPRRYVPCWSCWPLPRVTTRAERHARYGSAGKRVPVPQPGCY